MEEPVTTSSEIHTNEGKGGREGGREGRREEEGGGRGEGWREGGGMEGV